MKKPQNDIGLSAARLMGDTRQTGKSQYAISPDLKAFAEMLMNLGDAGAGFGNLKPDEPRPGLSKPLPPSPPTQKPSVNTVPVAGVRTFAPPEKLMGGKFGLKISRSSSFVLKEPIEVFNINSEPHRLIAFIKPEVGSPPYWLMAKGKWFNDEYFYVETSEPRLKLSLEDIEKKLGYKVEIVG